MSPQEWIGILEQRFHCKKTGRNSWMARCPAHDERTPSLHITMKDDGRLLIHCHGQQCSPHDIVAATGADLGALFPDDRDKHYRAETRKRDITVDEMVLAICDSDRKKGIRLSDADKRREREAFVRLRAAGIDVSAYQA